MSSMFSPEEFEELVVQALEDLPDFFKQQLQNVDFVVADWPTEAELRTVGLQPGQLLCGLYHGSFSLNCRYRFSCSMYGRISMAQFV